MYPFILKIIKFGLTGLLGLLIDFSGTWLCKEKFKWNKYLANCCGFTAAVICNYYINRHWTFSSSNPFWLHEFARFLLISIIGLLLNTTFVYVFHKLKKQNFYAAKFLSVLIVFVWNFSANFFFNFK